MYNRVETLQGKDSTYSALKAVKYGHTLIALANLYTEKGSETDSWMYQTVGTDAVETYSKCMGLPIYRMPISKAVSIASEDLEYTEVTDELNEVEVLYALLFKVKSDFPELQAVCSGAILSNYQRLRVEHVYVLTAKVLNLVKVFTTGSCFFGVFVGRRSANTFARND